jgi:16S rRNA (adenine1518-N6/adenine1519-N6)-dimethyltransferase
VKNRFDSAIHAAHVPRKRFGQHFLHDPGILRRIVELISPRPGERLIEIGPGEGALTLPLLRAAGKLTAIELDRDLIEPLRAKAQGVGELDVINADVLNVDFGALAQGATLRVDPSRPSLASGALALLRIVGNLPYNISTPILFHCLEHAGAIHDMHFMLQKEVVERMAAPPGSKTYGRLSVMLQLRCTVEPLLRVPPGAFRPPPKVDSAVVRLVPLPAPALPRVDGKLLERVVRAAFGQRRKTLSNALSEHADAPDFAAAGIDPRARAEQLAPSAFVALAQRLQAK